MPAIRRLLLPALLMALPALPALAQTLATSTDLIPVQVQPGNPPVSSAPPAPGGPPSSGPPPQQTRPAEGGQSPAQSNPAPTGRCTPARPTS